MSLFDLLQPDNRVAHMTAFVQRRTYGDVLIGGPHKRLNDWLLSNVERRAREILGDWPTILVPPSIRIEADGNEALPPVQNMSRFELYCPVRRQLCAAIVIWHDESPEPRITPTAERILEAIDLAAVATPILY